MDPLDYLSRPFTRTPSASLTTRTDSARRTSKRDTAPGLDGLLTACRGRRQNFGLGKFLEQPIRPRWDSCSCGARVAEFWSDIFWTKCSAVRRDLQRASPTEHPIPWDAFDYHIVIVGSLASASYDFPTTAQVDASTPPVPATSDCQTASSNAIDTACVDGNQPTPTVCRRHSSCLQLDYQSQTGDLQGLESRLGGSSFAVVGSCGTTTLYSMTAVPHDQM